ncbi:deleted in malignant brain tumors 1 protein isoform X2 [Patella vulgata]|uniref:deleted in malignant brain tumors 1 protein isoform X2 n=1 Tax=Patella vulgata TaxID=6465 RepID=UPI002180704D|nr:deleted in malignant brain tumors 1 protein isoform X2 [Patella vulgata]
MMLSQLVLPLLLLIQLSDGNIINEKVQYEQSLNRLKRGDPRYKHFPPNRIPTTVPTTTTATIVTTTAPNYFTPTATVPTSTTPNTNVCGSESRQGDVTTIDHPGTGGDYGNNQNCTWTVCTNTPGVNVTITRIYIEDDPLCILTIQRNRYCGALRRNGEVATIQGCVRVSFTSDGSVTGSGFRIEIRPLQNFIATATTSRPPRTTTSRPPRTNVCGSESRQGDVTTIDHPGTGSDYGNNQNCTWTVCTNTPGVRVDITRIDIEGLLSSCVYDALTIQSRRYCGGVVRRNVEVATIQGCVRVSFTSDGSVTGSGFRIEIRPLQNFTATSTTSRPPSTNVCGLERRQGNVTTIDHPGTGGDYGNNQNCTWTVCTNTPGVRVDITRIDIESSSSCAYDVLTIQSRRYCGGFVIRNVEVATIQGCVRVSFTSDGSFTGSGFRIEIRPLQNFIATTTRPTSTTSRPRSTNVCALESRQGYITTIDHPGTGGNYGNNQNCTWTVCTNTPGVLVNITRIDIERTSSCAFDVLTIQRNKYCGFTEWNFEVTTYTGCVQISFSSDGSLTGTGFSLTITPKQYQDGDTIINPDGKVLIYNNGTWGVICPDQWGDYEVQVACREAGYLYGVALTLPRPVVNTPIEYTVECTGEERNIRSCDVQYTDECSTTDRSGAFCGSNPLRLIGTNSNNGRVQILYNNTWAYLCIPNDIYGDAVNAICQQFGYKAGDLEILPRTSSLRDEFWANVFRCLTYGRPLNQCRSEGWSFQRDCQFGHQTVYCYGSVRLDTGYRNSTGAVLVYDNREYKTICRDGFDQNAVNVVCSELGFPSGGRLLPGQYSIVNRTMINKIYTCAGNETSLADCRTFYPRRVCSSVAAVSCVVDDQNSDPGCNVSMIEADLGNIKQEAIATVNEATDVVARLMALLSKIRRN